MKYVLEVILIVVVVSSITVMGLGKTMDVVASPDTSSGHVESTVNDSLANDSENVENNNGGLIKDYIKKTTSNGKDLFIGKILNGNNKTLEKQVSIDGLEFLVTLYPYDEWNYAESENFILVPSRSGSLIHNMAYYDKGKQLRAFVNFTDGTDTYIYVGRKGRPYRVYVDSSFTSWNYNPNTRIVKIHSSFGSLHEIVLGWNDYLRKSPGAVFIEDTKRKEDMLYEEEQINDRVDALQPKFDMLNKSKNNLAENIDDLKMRINQTKKANSNLVSNITETNTTISDLKESFKDMVILSPLKTTLTVLIIVAIILFALYSVFMKGDENE